MNDPQLPTPEGRALANMWAEFQRTNPEIAARIIAKMNEPLGFYFPPMPPMEIVIDETVDYRFLYAPIRF